jgi:hypothetical protein
MRMTKMEEAEEARTLLVVKILKRMEEAEEARTLLVAKVFKKMDEAEEARILLVVKAVLGMTRMDEAEEAQILLVAKEVLRMMRTKKMEEDEEARILLVAKMEEEAKADGEVPLLQLEMEKGDANLLQESPLGRKQLDAVLVRALLVDLAQEKRALDCLSGRRAGRFPCPFFLGCFFILFLFFQIYVIRLIGRISIGF